MNKKISTLIAFGTIIALAILVITGVLFYWNYLIPESEFNTQITNTKTKIKTKDLDKIAGECLCKGMFGAEKPLLSVDYEINKLDLNDDGKEEIIAYQGHCKYEHGSQFAGGATGNEVFCIFQQKADNWIEIGNFIGDGSQVKEVKTNGYHDFENIINLGSAGCLRGIEEYKWDGFYYKMISNKEINWCEEEK